MSGPTIRDAVLAAWRGILGRHGAPPDQVDALVLELEQAMVGHGARLPRYARLFDSVADPLHDHPEPGDAAAGAAAARAQLRPFAGPDRDPGKDQTP